MWSVAPTPKLAAQLIEMTEGLSLTLDYGHYTTQGFPDSEIEPLLAHTTHIHARAACQGLLQTTLANNTIDFAGVVRAMQRFDYPGCVALEYVEMDVEIVPDVDNLAETILLRDLLKKSWGTGSSRVH